MSESYTAFKCFAQKREHVYAIKNIGALWNFTKHLRPNFPEPYRVSAPEPSGTSPAICTGTLRNLTRYLHRNPPEPHKVHRNLWNLTRPAPKPCATSPAICIETLRNLTRYLHRNPPEPQQVSAPEPSGTLRNLARNLVLKLHRIAPELIWAKDPIAKFCCWGKTENNIRCS